MATVPLLIIDDPRMRKLPHTAAEDLLEIIMRTPLRTLQHSAHAQPSGRGPGRNFWGDVAAVSAMLDRLLHHGHVLTCWPVMKLAHENGTSIMRKDHSLRGPALALPGIYRSLARMTLETAGDDVLEGIKMCFSICLPIPKTWVQPPWNGELRTATGDSERLLLTPVGETSSAWRRASFITDAVYRDVNQSN